MQALYATPAWACCFYVFMFFTLFSAKSKMAARGPENG